MSIAGVPPLVGVTNCSGGQAVWPYIPKTNKHVSVLIYIEIWYVRFRSVTSLGVGLNIFCASIPSSSLYLCLEFLTLCVCRSWWNPWAFNSSHVQRFPSGVTFRRALSKLKAQSLNVSFHWNVAEETFELWASSSETAFENVTPSGIGCT